MGDWHAVGSAGMLADGQMQRVDLLDRVILLARVGGRYYATQGRCPHLRALLTRGQLTGPVVTCPGHGSRFDVTTGRCVAWVEGLAGIVRKAARALSTTRDLEVYDTRIEDEQVWVRF